MAENIEQQHGVSKSRKRRRGINNPNTINLMVIGDEGVGKSSLISTFVSRRFSEIVPDVMTRVRLPPDPSLSYNVESPTATRSKHKGGGGCVTTIVDTKADDFSSIESSSLNTASEDTTSVPLEIKEEKGDLKNIEGSTLSFNSDSSDSLGIKSVELLQNKNQANFKGTNFDSVDVIILVYDLEQDETFQRVENYWLPLLQQCYDEEVRI